MLRIHKIAAAVLFLIPLTMLCTGCWDRTEIEDRGFVLAVAIDEKKEKNDQDMTEQESREKKKTISVIG
jgi:hypothetical protein